MTNKLIVCCILLVACGPLYGRPGTAFIDHQLEVELMPARHELRVQDRIRLPSRGTREFLLHAGFQPRVLTPGVTLTRIAKSQVGDIPVERYRVSLPAGSDRFTLKYAGKIDYRLKSHKESPGRNRQLLSGTVSPRGVFLDAGVAWYPRFGDEPRTFSLTVTLPQKWRAVSQGAGPEEEIQAGQRRVGWRAHTPQDDIYLVAAPFHFYSSDAQGIQAQVFLRQDDPALAGRYLAATHRYLALYASLIGPYPYPKFALVENFWETGYGMPSFTLLGPGVIRLPFIVHTSFPHEILHNWWGNGVYVDYATGNWSEGLTAYLADHLLKEQRGKGIEYRRSALQRFADFVRKENDFPLRAFRARHSAASQAVGYDKGLMLFHMLRRRLGDEAFIAGLRRFYRDNRFQQAGFAQLQEAFEAVSGQRLGGFFKQWTRRTGAPRLAVEAVRVSQREGGYRLDGTLVQGQEDAPFDLQVPLIVYPQSQQPPILRRIHMQKRRQSFSIELTSAPARIDVDPWFDLFRLLLPGEVPSTLGGLFGARRVVFVLPAQAPSETLAAYRRLAGGWSEGYPEASIVLDRDLDRLPEKASVWLLGWENRFLESFVKRLDGNPVRLAGDRFQVTGKAFQRRDNSLVLTSGNRALLASDSVAALEGLRRKLPHYGKYSYLVFSGQRPDNRLKGQWPVLNSPLKIELATSHQAIQALRPTRSLWPAPGS